MRCNQDQVTIFTCCAWLTNSKHSFAVLSDYRSHDKYAMWYFLGTIIEHLKQDYPSVRKLLIFSDGAASQFKNRHTLSNLLFTKYDFEISTEWNFMATSHGKDAVDGVGAVLKQSLWRAVKGKRVVLNSAEDCH